MEFKRVHNNLIRSCPRTNSQLDNLNFRPLEFSGFTFSKTNGSP